MKKIGKFLLMVALSFVLTFTLSVNAEEASVSSDSSADTNVAETTVEDASNETQNVDNEKGTEQNEVIEEKTDETTPTVLTEIYLNGLSGNDYNDGSSRETAVKSFARAKELALANQSITRIYVTGQVDISGDVSLAGTNAIIIRDPSYTGDVFVINGSSVNLSNIIIDGNGSVVESSGSLIKVISGTLNINGGSKITNNNSSNAGIYDETGTINLNSGEISYNTSSSWGGGIAIWGAGIMNMTGGTISHNNGSAGGGLYMRGSSKDAISYFNMSGGTIEYNISNDFGGGIYIGANSVGTITAGEINYNEEKGNGYGGGGIYVNSDEHQPDKFSNGKLYIYNVEITGNSTTGGSTYYDSVIASCETGNVEVNITDGAVIHDNGAKNTVIVRQLDGSPMFVLTPFMLGGKYYNWTDQDGNPYSLDGIVWQGDKGDKFGFNKAITNVSTSDGTVSGLDRVKTRIAYNKSTYLGAAIGTNGEVYIGKSDGNVDINISKVWKTKSIPESIVIDVYATDGNGVTYKIGFVTLSESNGWKTQIKYLPKYDSEGKTYTYSFIEETSKYTLSLNTEIIDKSSDEQIYNVIFTNYDLAIVDPSVKKEIIGDKPSIDSKFNFGLYNENDNLIKEVSINGEGNAEFGEISFNEVGEYSYFVREIAGNETGYTYDGSIYKITYKVVETEDGLNVIKVVTKDGKVILSDDEVDFINRYELTHDKTEEVVSSKTNGIIPPKTGVRDNYDLIILFLLLVLSFTSCLKVNE